METSARLRNGIQQQITEPLDRVIWTDLLSFRQFINLLSFVLIHPSARKAEKTAGLSPRTYISAHYWEYMVSCLGTARIYEEAE